MAEPIVWAVDGVKKIEKKYMMKIVEKSENKMDNPNRYNKRKHGTPLRHVVAVCHRKASLQKVETA